jgi:outer membrane lipoprotein-sorting protein
MNIVPAFCLPLALAIFAWSGALHTQQTGSKEATLKALDASSAKFTSAQASFQKEIFTKLVNEKETQNGITYTIHKGSSTEVGLKIEGAGARTVQYDGRTLRDYNPGIKCYNAYDAAKYKATADSILGLSFGTSGKELETNWAVTDLGSEALTVDGKTTKVEKLDLIPKVSSVKDNYTHVTLWMDLSTAVSLKQIFYAKTGDTTTATYSNVRLNKDVNKGPFKIEGKPCK